MEAPEKIYIDDPTGEFNDNWSIYQNNISTEYTRTDVFIERADKFISTFFHPDDTELIDAVLNRFHEYMKLE